MIDPERILVIRRKAIGDVLVSMDTVVALSERWPKARIAMVVDRFAASVVEGSSAVHEVIIYDRRSQSTGTIFARARAFVSWLRRLRRLRAQLTVDLMGTPQTALWTAVSGATVRVGPAKRHRSWAYTHPVAPSQEAVFAGERFLDWLRAIDLSPGPWRPQAIRVPAAVEERVTVALDLRRKTRLPLVFLNASATWAAKAWPLAHFAQLGRSLREAECEVALVWGPGEEQARDTIVREARGAVWALPPTDLVELAAWFGRAALVVSTDSGPKHLAVAQGTPTVTVFGSTDPRGWQPRGREHLAMTNPVDCHPCDLLECIVDGHPCLQELLPSTVASAVIAQLGRLERSA